VNLVAFQHARPSPHPPQRARALLSCPCGMSTSRMTRRTAPTGRQGAAAGFPLPPRVAKSSKALPEAMWSSVGQRPPQPQHPRRGEAARGLGATLRPVKLSVRCPDVEPLGMWYGLHPSSTSQRWGGRERVLLPIWIHRIVQASLSTYQRYDLVQGKRYGPTACGEWSFGPFVGRPSST
jgi:hypothetical protein